MFSESTRGKIIKQEKFLFGGRVERMDGRMCYLDGTPVQIESNDNPTAHTENNVQTVKALEALFMCLFPEIVFPKFSVFDLFNEVTGQK